MGEWFFEVVDKSGRRIHLSKERWSHILKHPGLVNIIERIEETLQHPDVILPFQDDPGTHFYFRFYKDQGKYLFISVKYLNGEGFIITSFYTDKTQ